MANSTEMEIELLKACVAAMKKAHEVGCVDHLDCCADAGAFWYEALENAEAALATDQPTDIRLLDPDMPAQKLRLHMGEMTAQEVRTARAAIRWANSYAGGSHVDTGGYASAPPAPVMG